ncbi:MAG: ATP-binding protein [Legionellales bacterium]
MFNKLLLKQIQKKYGSLENVPPEMLELLNTISHTYNYYERERQLLERSMDLSSNEMIEANEKLEQQAQKLQRSNQELKEFAYAVSHDLKEPLRTIASYVQLIELRLKGKFDSETKEFMDFAVSGVKKLQTMLEGMLKYAQVGEEQKDFSLQDLNKVLEMAVDNLRDSIQSNGAVVEITQPLPQIRGNRVQLILLFQNLIANSIKFRSKAKPHVEITVRNRNTDYLFSVIDNGIGATDSNKQSLFAMFKRGHSNNYEGIGMGLPICKKIVENHGGVIWIDESTTTGLRIDFTLPRAIKQAE